MGLFSKAFKSKDSNNGALKSKKKAPQSNGAIPVPPAKPHWDDAWTRKEVEPEEIQELLRACTQEMKSRALDMPFFLLPFRPASDPSAARTFIRNFFSMEKGAHLVGERLEQELMLTEPMVLSSVMKWCWSRLAGGVVTAEAYELFRVGEQDSNMARNAFATFIPLSVDSDARTKIIFDFFDLMAAIAAHGKTNGMGGRKLSRFAGWWAFEHTDELSGFDGGYRSWTRAADATSHLFFAYLRSLSPDSVRGISGVSTLPLSLQSLLNETRYPPEHANYRSTSKVVMVVNSISPTPFALLRRAKNFEYRDDDRVLQAFSNYDDPVQALSDECRRVLKSISHINESNATTTKASTSLGNASWSRFEDIGFGAISEFDEEGESALGHSRTPAQSLHPAARTKVTDAGRPTTPSWADFLSSGFADQASSPNQRPLVLPPDKILPPIDLDTNRGKSSQSQVRRPNNEDLEPGELASINALQLDDAFWWVWITSLAGEETLQRKAVFGRCALIETTLDGAWLVIEEMVKGAAPEPEVGAYIAEKKGRFTFGRKRNAPRPKSMGRKTQLQKSEPYSRTTAASASSKTSIGHDQHARIQAAAAALQEKERRRQREQDDYNLSPRRARGGDGMSTKTNSVFTLQPVIMSEAAPAMKWATSYDKKSIRAAYLGSELAGKGSATDLGALANPMSNGPISPKAPAPIAKDTPPEDYGFPQNTPKVANVPLPAETPGEISQAPSHPPPPLPKDPFSSILPQAPTAYQAATSTPNPAEVPLPTPVPAEIPLPTPAPEGEALKQVQTVTSDQQDPLQPASSPESNRSGQKLKKKEGRNFKALFGKKKTLPAPPPQNRADPLAAAAARAALANPRPQNQGSNSMTRRLSRIGGKDAPTAAAPPVPMRENQDEDGLLPPPPAPFRDEYDSQVSLSRVDSHERREAENEYSKFDQGPLTDQTAFTPGESPIRDRRSAPTDSPTVSRPSTAEPVGAHYDPPIAKGGEYEPSISSRGTEGETNLNGGAEDRWAQIRKNAAERAKASGGEQQVTAGRKSSVSMGDGEESGEETIESKVARIKARVAELTGNMQGQEPART